MVKVTVGEMSYEGTAEEIKDLFEVLGAEFPNNSEATEGTGEEVSEDLPVGTKIKVKSDGRLMTLSERKPKHDGTGFGKAYGLKGKSTWLGEEQFEVVEDSDEVTKPPFKVGDTAVVTGETHCGDIVKGEKVRITQAELDEDGELRIDLLDGSDFDWAKPEALELVVDEGETTLKNGDKVRLLHGGNKGSAQGFYNGKIYEVVDVNWKVRDGEHRVCIGEVGGTNEGYVDIEQLEKVLEGVTEQVPTEEIEVGDIISTKFYGILEVYGISECDCHEIKVRINGRDDALERKACTLVAKKSDRKDV